MTQMSTEEMTVAEMVESLTTPCEYSDQDSCSKLGAEWVLFRVKCTCGAGGAALACNKCKEDRESSEDCVECEFCGEVTAPARYAYSYIEYINRRP